MHVFWAQGYEATSMQDLERATRLKPGSLYNAFGSKRKLFSQVLEFYREQVVAERVNVILNRGKPLNGIARFFNSTFEQVPPDQLLGCLLTNTATEEVAENELIQATVAGGIEQIQVALERRLREAKAAGSISQTSSPAKLALHLTACYQGLCVMGRLNRDKAQLKLIAEQALASIANQGNHDV
ncbi:MAG: TetR/AcrR family transcriptional regulator [Burkholderiaceae bacterium]